MIRTWIPISIPTRIVFEKKNDDGTYDYARRSVIAFSIDDSDYITYMTCSGIYYTSHGREFAFAEQLQNGEWQS
ncbi:hypothetical protein UFOVP366_43 [uncultured Caudovirales phage]|uniref:Uncharacterized protein n=1 Tax=uncultured Caudovirales phage TaxID=2100421 RepID=A0A6J7X1N1_9CAUD|nr:hypothetical protein UFOVP366_43 [uncultured Caudovirales phage]